MSDLRGKNIISEYLVYVDNNYNKLKGNANFYEASESLRIHIDDELFLIVDSWDFIRELNEWLNDNYAKELYDETRYELPEDIRDREYFTIWLDYLTDGMWGFSDEYSVCEHCNKAFRTSPDSYSWVANYWIGDGFIICEDCVRKDYSEEYLESLENNPNTANTILSDDEIKKAGYKKIVADCESGWCGRCDDPEKMLEQEKKSNKDGRYLFSISGTGQFHTDFDMWEKIAQKVRLIDMREIRINTTGDGCWWLYNGSEIWKDYVGCEDFNEQVVLYGNRDYSGIEEASWYQKAKEIVDDINNYDDYPDDMSEENKEEIRKILLSSCDDVPVEVLRILYPDDEFKTGTIRGYSQGDWEYYIVKGDVDVEQLEAYYFGNVVDIFVKDNEEKYSDVMTCEELWDAEREGYEKVFRERYGIPEDEELKIYVADGYIQTLNWELVSQEAVL